LIRTKSKKYDWELKGFDLGDFTVKLSEEVADKLLILIDIASTNEDYLQKVYFISVRCSTSKIVMGTTSGFGHYKRTTYHLEND